ncbi:unnamed protein product [Meloidogyne enterolobii]|uniref:Uncharacterized protein n=1 Tax=Meloidogyne enterolobii TaxID=390850 RepID=A0ACB0XZU3_MELEN
MEETIKSNKGNVKYEHNGFLYVFHKFNKDGDIKFWRCEFCNTNDFTCKGRLHTDLQGNVLRQVGEHNCPSGAENIGAKRIITTIKKRAIETMETPAILRANTLQNVPTPILAQVPNKQAVKKIIKRARTEIEAPVAVPLNLEDLQIPQHYQIYMRTEAVGEQFLLADSGVYIEGGRQHRILVFGRESYGAWSREMKEIFVDGTFSIAPNFFSQIYAILARFTILISFISFFYFKNRRHNWVLPVLYCLLSNKSQATYERMWVLIRNFWPDFEPNSISMDYEAAAINSIRAIFPMCEIRGCLYHLTHNLKKKLAEEGLTQRYRTDAEFAVMCRMITAVAFLPIQDISIGVMALDSGFMPHELDPIIDWFVINYTGRLRINGTRTEARFPPDIWSVYHRTLDGDSRTNNFAESSHRRLQQAFSCCHPSIWKFIDTLKREQKSRDADMAKCISGEEPPKKARRYREADARILNIVGNYIPINQGNPFQLDPNQHFHFQPIIDFLRGIAYNYQMDQ